MSRGKDDRRLARIETWVGDVLLAGISVDAADEITPLIVENARKIPGLWRVIADNANRYRGGDNDVSY